MLKVRRLWFEGSQQLNGSFTIQKILRQQKRLKKAGLVFAPNHPLLIKL